MHLFPLDVRSDAAKLRRSYLQLALKYHPDKATVLQLPFWSG